ncbi:MAG: hypothetical protein EWM47_06800 [Anaerolineaceae bacterium]|nr:MAG: hypothetical protein EWM47_06800 [Anaerolineaceae bacterium]
MKKKKKYDDFVDDGRVIANMNIDGMPRSTIKRTAFDEFGKVKENNENKENVKLSKSERRSIILGVVTSYALFAVIVFGAFALFILFCINVWFK